MDRLYNYEADLDQYADDAYYFDKFLQTLNNLEVWSTKN